MQRLLSIFKTKMATPEGKADVLTYAFNLVVIVMFSLVSVLFWNKAKEVAWFPLSVLSLAYFSLLAHYKNWSCIARCILAVVPVYGIVFSSALLKSQGIFNDVLMYISPRFISFSLLISPVILFGIANKTRFLSSFLLGLIPVVFFDHIHRWFGVHFENLTFSPSYYPFTIALFSIFFIVALLTLITIQIINADRLDEIERSKVEMEEGKKILEQQNLELEFNSHLFEILEITSRTDISVREIMTRVLKNVLKVKKLGLSGKGVIFLTNEEGKLELIHQENAKALEDSCAVVNPGQCLCGKVLAHKNHVFCNDVGHAHDIVPKGMSPHGHYVAPIKHNDKVLGVFNVYIEANAERNKVVDRYLEAVCELLARRIAEDHSTQQITRQQKVLKSVLKDITDSLNYAMRLQTAMLPNKQTLYKQLGKAYFLFLPKDVVSGDFYFSYKSGRQSVIYNYFGVGDCTGHGIPGAFLSAMSVETLKQVVFGMPGSTPEKILEAMRLHSKARFSINKETQRNDMLDMAICRYDKTNMELLFSGANMDLLILSDGKLTRYKGTRNPIGSYPVEKPFDLQTVPVKKGDYVYMYTDGFVDQFGFDSSRNRLRKLKTKGLEKMILDLKDKPFEEHKKQLYKSFNNWKEGFDATDDATLLCVEIEGSDT